MSRIGRIRSNDAYAWTGHYNVNRPYSSDGRNQLTQSGSIVPVYDERGNLNSAGTTPYAYDGENRMKTAGPTDLDHDPLGRLIEMTTGTSKTRFGYDGLDMIAEYDGADAVQRRFVHGPGVDEPLVQYEGSGLAVRRWLHADERDSIVAISDSAGTAITKNSYDEYGIPGTANAGRFQYTGQAWLPEIGMQYSKNRIYSPTLGRFLQTDPIGTAGGINLYAYVGNDPINFVDRLGFAPVDADGTIVVTGTRLSVNNEFSFGGGGFSFYSTPTNFSTNFAFGDGGGGGGGGEEIVVTGTRPPPVPAADLIVVAPQSLERNGQKPPSHDDDDPDYNRDLNRCRALADAGNRLLQQDVMRVQRIVGRREIMVFQRSHFRL